MSSTRPAHLGPRRRHRDGHGRARSRRTRSPSGPSGSVPRSRPTAGSRSSRRPSTATGPILAVHDPGLVRFLEEAWPEVARQRIDRAFLIADTYPTRAMFEGMSDEFAGESAGARARSAGAPAGGASTRRTRSSPGPTTRPAAAVDVALTTADLVLGGERAAYGLCRPPGHHAAARDGRRLLLLQQRRDRGRVDRPADRGAGRDPRRRLPPRQRHPADLLAPRRRPVRVAPRRPGAAVPVLPRPRRRDGRGRRGRART